MINLFNEELAQACDLPQTDLPFTSEVLHRELRSHAGPTLAATLLFSVGSYGVERNDDCVSAALAVEMLGLFPTLLSQLFSVRLIAILTTWPNK